MEQLWNRSMIRFMYGDTRYGKVGAVVKYTYRDNCMGILMKENM